MIGGKSIGLRIKKPLTTFVLNDGRRRKSRETAAAGESQAWGPSLNFQRVRLRGGWDQPWTTSPAKQGERLSSFP
jgi:hypothetical protein